MIDDDELDWNLIDQLICSLQKSLDELKNFGVFSRNLSMNHWAPVARESRPAEHRVVGARSSALVVPVWVEGRPWRELQSIFYAETHCRSGPRDAWYVFCLVCAWMHRIRNV